MSNTDALIDSLNLITVKINRHGALLMIIIGSIGNLLNICVLNERVFCNSPCSIYLWWSSATSIIFIWSGLLTRVLDGYGISWPNQNQPVCKIRIFIFFICWSVATFAFVGASIDRFLVSSLKASYPSLSSSRTARRLLIIILIISVLVYVEVFYCYEANVPNVPTACYTLGRLCQSYNDWMYILYNIVVPSGLMLLFGMLTIFNIRKRIVYPTGLGTETRRRTRTVVLTTNSINQRRLRLRKIDRHLRKLILVQVLVLLILSLPVGIQRLYASLTANVSKVALRVAIENLIYAIVVLIHFAAYSISFYLYILTDSLFRTTLKGIIYRQVSWIQPSHQQSIN